MFRNVDPGSNLIIFGDRIHVKLLVLVHDQILTVKYDQWLDRIVSGIILIVNILDSIITKRLHLGIELIRQILVDAIMRSTISIKPVVHFVRHLITGFKVVDYIFHIMPRRKPGSSGHLRFELFVLHHISQSFLSALNRCNLKPVVLDSGAHVIQFICISANPQHTRKRIHTSKLPSTIQTSILQFVERIIRGIESIFHTFVAIGRNVLENGTYFNRLVNVSIDITITGICYASSQCSRSNDLKNFFRFGTFVSCELSLFGRISFALILLLKSEFAFTFIGWDLKLSFCITKIFLCIANFLGGRKKLIVGFPIIHQAAKSFLVILVSRFGILGICFFDVFLGGINGSFSRRVIGIPSFTSGSQGTILVLVPTNSPFHAFDTPVIEFVIVAPHSLLHFDLFEHLSIELPSNVCIHHSRNSINLLIVSNLQKFSVTVSVLDYNTVAHGELHKGFVE